VSVKKKGLKNSSSGEVGTALNGTFSCSEKDIVLELDNNAREILGIERGVSIRSKRFREVFGLRSDDRRNMLKAMREDSGRFLGEITLSLSSGRERVVLLSETLKIDERGRHSGSTGTFVDVTMDRKWEREFFNIARNIGGTLDEGKIIDRVAIDLSRLTGCHTCSVVMFDEDGIKAHIRSSVKISKIIVRRLSEEISKGVGIFLEYTMESSDMKPEPKILDEMETAPIEGRRNIKTRLTVPLIVGADLVGFIHLGAFSPVLINEKEKSNIVACSSHIAYALYNARTFEKQEKLIQMKSSFLANLSHSLRTPMATMKQSVSLLLRERGGPLTEIQRKFLGIMGENVDRLTGVLNNLLDLSKIEFGSMDLNRTEIDMVLLARSIADSFDALMINKGIRFSVSVKPSSIRAFVDSEIMRQIIEGIVGNAIKFTPKKKSIRLKMTGSDKRVMVSIQDEGCGISRQNLSMAFDKYRSFQKGIKAGVKGTGLGLALTKELVELHGGKIWIESKVRKGTTVNFVIPRMPFSSILQEKMMRSMELCNIKGEGLVLFLYIANLDRLPPTAIKIKKLKEKLGSYLGPILGNIDGHMIVDEGEERVAVIAPVKFKNRDSIERVIKQNFNEIINKNRDTGNSLYSWVRYPDEGKNLAELLKALLTRAGIKRGEFPQQHKGR